MSTNFLKEKGHWITFAEAARLRGVTRQAISKLVKNGRLKTVEFGGQTFVNKKETLNFSPKKPGRPKSGGTDVSR